MTDLTRRGFVRNSAGAAAGMSVLGALLTEGADADAFAPGSQSVLAYVHDPSKGEIALMTAEGEVTVRDAKLAARIARAAR